MVIICVGGWLVYRGKLFRTPSGQLASHDTVETYQPKLADLRDLAPLRGAEGKPPAPIGLSRGRLALTLYLPTGSEPRQYEVEVAERLDQPLATATGSAKPENGIAVLEVKLDLAGLHPGLYLLGIRQTGKSWNPYTVLPR